MKNGARRPYALTHVQVDDLEASMARTAATLSKAGYSASKIRGLVRLDLYDIYERRSAVCAYQQLRADKIVHAIFPDVSIPACQGRWLIPLATRSSSGPGSCPKPIFTALAGCSVQHAPSRS